ncbi:hypothetical protein [uncultured Chloroflexus sp.]|uniref:hypothetical protein n=1 Tax=uncultured Chloroflexus sp. TaxID=214040 RepID=UPI002623F8A8|nr:hypothetical protein [uncultured Chloroflexus sp.]
MALTLVPIYFNLYSARHFEPDKAVVLRSLALIGIAAGLVWFIDRSSHRTTGATQLTGSWWTTLRNHPLFWPVVAYTGIFAVTTITSITPAASLWGSYQRMQGLYTYLSYLMLGGLIAVALRAPDQRERFISLSLAASAVVAIYGIMQHYQLDPLPWRGDVIARVASTLGNSIFVAAYLIMIVPLALYRLVVALAAARSAPPATQPLAEWRHAFGAGILWLAGTFLIIATLKFSVAIRTIDFRYWWVFPGAIICATAIWWLLTVPRHQRRPHWPLFLTLAYLLGFGLAFAFNATAGVQQFAPVDVATNAQDWWLWLALAILALLSGYGLSFFGNPPAGPSRLGWSLHAATSAAVLALILITIFFSQSRGPWIGLGAGLFLFGSLALWYGRKHLQASGYQRGSRWMARALAIWILVTFISGGFLIAFNLSDAPLFARLREVPYIGRMGRLLEVESGTGLVRRLIWVGDQHARGTIGLITSDPVRLFIGWGPESMFVAFNRFYPPSLANVEARGASPDRSHQAFLDEIVTKGLIGLAAYLWLIGSFGWFCVRQLRQSASWRHQVLIIALLSAITAHLVEGLTGIPIVATLMLFWMMLGLSVAAERIERAAEQTTTLEATPVEARPAARQGNRRPPTRSPTRRSAARQPGVGMAGIVGLISLTTAGLIWWLNVQPVYADMRFQQAQSYNEQGQTSSRALLTALNEYIATIRTNPGEDFYYLHLARTLMTLADLLRAQGAAIGEAGTPDLDALLRLNGVEEVTAFAQRSSPLSLLAYAEAALQRAHQLSPLNKDHYANLGRINTFWYGWTGDVQRLYVALNWYERVAEIAPRDVALINERAGVLMQLAEYATINGEPQQAGAFFQQAEELLQTSARFDPRYGDTALRLGDLIRFRTGDLDAAATLYAQAVELSPQQMVENLDRIARALNSRPDLLQQLRAAFAAQAERADQELAAARGKPERAFELSSLEARTVELYAAVARLAVQTGDFDGALTAYARATELQPTSVALSQQYTLVLSETLQYDAAIAEAQRLLTVLRAAGRVNDIARVEQLITAVERARQ